MKAKILPIKKIKNKGSVKMKDWSGNKTSVHSQNSSQNIFDKERHSEDFYATPPIAAEDLLKFNIYPKITNVWECACGNGSLSKVFDKYGLLGKSTDLIDRNYGTGNINFLDCKEKWNGWIITNPPYIYAKEFVEKAIELADIGVAMYLKIQFLESKKRLSIFKNTPPKYVYVYSRQTPQCAFNGDFNKPTGNAVMYCWFIWIKNYSGDTIIKWKELET